MLKRGKFTTLSFVWRLVATTLLVFLTYNPTEYSYAQWIATTAANDATSLGAPHVFLGLLLFIGWVILIVATRSSLGLAGVLLGGLLLGALVWLLIDAGWLAVNSVDQGSWVVLVALSVLLTLGLTWSHIWRRLTGQVDVTEGDND